MNKAAQQLGKLGGLVKSPAKERAARENGKLGGRPKKRKHGKRTSVGRGRKSSPASGKPK